MFKGSEIIWYCNREKSSSSNVLRKITEFLLSTLHHPNWDILRSIANMKIGCYLMLLTIVTLIILIEKQERIVQKSHLLKIQLKLNGKSLM